MANRMPKRKMPPTPEPTEMPMMVDVGSELPCGEGGVVGARCALLVELLDDDSDAALGLMVRTAVLVLVVGCLNVSAMVEVMETVFLALRTMVLV